MNRGNEAPDQGARFSSYSQYRQQVLRQTSDQMGTSHWTGDIMNNINAKSAYQLQAVWWIDCYKSVCQNT